MVYPDTASSSSSESSSSESPQRGQVPPTCLTWAVNSPQSRVVLESGIVCEQRYPSVTEASMSLVRRIPEVKSQEGRFFP
jgi:hypothetical protein